MPSTNRNDLTIRPATRGDAGAIHRVHTRSITTLCPNHYPGEVINGWLRGRTPEGYYSSIDTGSVFVAEIAGEVAGFGRAVKGEVLSVYVDPDHASRGVGSLLLAHAIAVAREGHDGPIAVVSTINAEAFYLKHGFTVVNRTTEPRNNIEIAIVEMELRQQ